MLSIIMASIAAYGLLYGDFHQLHRRLIDSLINKAPGMRAMFWCNQVCRQTLGYLAKTPFEYINSETNVPKYEAMAKMWESHIPEDFVAWFDDDSHILADDWAAATNRFLESKKSENVCYVGQAWYIHWRPGQWDWVRKQPWYRGRPPQLLGTKRGKPAPGVEFAQGAYWLLRNDVRLLLNWPASAVGLKHNGGDVTLAEAVRQQGLPFHKNSYGVRVNDAPRRGYSESPVGCLDKNTRV